MREEFEGKIEIVGGEAHIVFPDDSTLSVGKIVQEKFNPKKGGDSYFSDIYVPHM